jgi:putative aldouronate transport system permease protein
MEEGSHMANKASFPEMKLSHGPRKIRMPASAVAFNVVAYIVVTFVALFCLLPFLTIISGSFSDNTWITKHGYTLLPQQFSFKAYEIIFRTPDRILKAYAVTGLNTIAGTTTGLFCMSMAGYVLSRKSFKHRNKLMFFIYFTTLFGGGLVPWYIMIAKVFKLMDSYIAIWYPMLMSPFLIILMRTFITSAFPDEVMESAIIDGAGHFRIYRSIVLPIVIPGLAAVGLLLSLNYWNDWYLSSLFISTQGKFELQFYLYNMLNSVEEIRRLTYAGANINQVDAPTETLKLAMAVIATGPVLFFYPFAQRYFIAGITIGAVKG